MSRPQTLKRVGAGILFAAAGYLFYRQLTAGPGPGERAYFYDVSAAKVFTTDRTAIPPIRGVDGPEEDGYRAVVFSATGQPEDRASWRVAYLETCTPELKTQIDQARKTGTALAMGRMEAQAHRLVRRLTDADWVPMNAPAAEEILNGWAVPGPNGVSPVLCTP